MIQVPHNMLKHLLIWSCLLHVSYQIQLADDFNQKFQRTLGFTATALVPFQSPCQEYDNEICARKFLQQLDYVLSRNNYVSNEASYQYASDLTRENKNRIAALSPPMNEIYSQIEKEARKFHIANFTPTVQRIFAKFNTSETFEENIQNRLNLVKANLSEIYGNAQACPVGMLCLGKGEQPVLDLIITETDYDKRLAVWRAWHNATGPSLLKDYKDLIKVVNDGAHSKGYVDAGQAEKSIDFNDAHFDESLLKLYEEIQPFYQQLHAYVRYRLQQVYPGRFPPNGHIPAHIIGDVWSKEWEWSEKLLLPYPKAHAVDITPALANKTMLQIVRMADEFFQSLGLQPMTEDFWKYSSFEKPPGKSPECHATATDMGNGRDFRIQMCGSKKPFDFHVIHHEMGHVQYYMLYSPLIFPFRDGANVAFHEAVGDTISLSANTLNHLHQVKLISELVNDPENDMNQLMRAALAKVSFLPYALSVDTWRWKVFNGSCPPEQFNNCWWQLRRDLCGIAPPEDRPDGGADALSKYHVALDVSYTRYFISFIIQFQFYEALCTASGHQGELHKCDFYNSLEAGNKLKQVLSMGSSQPWQVVMKAFTGDENVSTKSLLKYFSPLYEWLRKENKRLNVKIGWN